MTEANFKFDTRGNRYVLRKSNGLQATANVLSALGGATADIKPSEDDYVITIQYGDAGIAFINVLFYKPTTYHEILTFAMDSGDDILETNSSMLNKIQYNYNVYSFELNRKLVGVSSTTGKTSSLVKTKDESYDVYNYTIYTGIEANSELIRKEKQKQAKRDAKGKKQKDVSTFM